jgi:hypothetical protein
MAVFRDTDPFAVFIKVGGIGLELFREMGRRRPSLGIFLISLPVPILPFIRSPQRRDFRIGIALEGQGISLGHRRFTILAFRVGGASVYGNIGISLSRDVHSEDSALIDSCRRHRCINLEKAAFESSEIGENTAFGKIDLVGILTHGKDIEGGFLIEPQRTSVSQLKFRSPFFGNPELVPFAQGHVDGGGDPIPRFLRFYLYLSVKQADTHGPEGRWRGRGSRGRSRGRGRGCGIGIDGQKKTCHDQDEMDGFHFSASLSLHSGMSFQLPLCTEGKELSLKNLRSL